MLKWAKETPAGFVFALKAPQDITHMNRLSVESYDKLEFFLSRAKYVVNLAITFLPAPMEESPVTRLTHARLAFHKYPRIFHARSSFLSSTLLPSHPLAVHHSPRE